MPLGLLLLSEDFVSLSEEVVYLSIVGCPLVNEEDLESGKEDSPAGTSSLLRRGR